MVLRPFLYGPTSCASYLFGCTSAGLLAVVDAHEDLVDSYLATAREIGAPIVAAFETHVQADHVSGLPALVDAGATPYLPADSGVEFEHAALADGDRVELGNTVITALATPGHAPAHVAYVVADRRRGEEAAPWLVFTGDSLLVNDVGRPDLHVVGGPERLARILHRSLGRLLELPDGVVVLPSHYGGSVCGRRLSGNPVSTIGFERAHNASLRMDEAAFVAESLRELPPPPADQAAIVAANRAGRSRIPA